MARLKTTDVYEALQNKHPPELVKIIAAIVERQQVQHQQMMTIADTVNSLIDRFTDVVNVVHHDREAVAKRLGFKNTKSMVESFEEKDDDPSATTSR